MKKDETIHLVKMPKLQVIAKDFNDKLQEKKLHKLICNILGHKLEGFMAGSDNYCLRCNKLMV